MKYGFAIAFMVEILVASWFISITLENAYYGRGYSVTGTVTVTNKWQGDNAPYENLTIRTSDGRVFSQVVSCDLYQNGTKVTVTGYDSVWILPFIASNIFNEHPHFIPADGCTQVVSK